MKRRINSWKWYLLLGNLILIAGCSTSSTETEFSIPDRFTAENSTWKLNGYISDEENSLIERTIELNPGVADFEELEGKQYSYRCENGWQRYYWVLSHNTTSKWFYLEFNELELIDMQSGTGLPFVSSPSP